MNYQVLARKYRPQNFCQLKGQESLVTTITHAIKDNKIAHAFLLTGIQGIGKTTTARIIAKTINCTNLGSDLVPCGTCHNCSNFASESHPDIIELDAASKTGIDDIREIIESANYAPILAKYKVYIIDEVHMLSTSAFNALLKTLEEPPAHVKFIFATTEAKKIPLTIVSRCQRFDLRRLTASELQLHLEEICKLEKVQFAESALKLIALHSNGSVRDSLSLLDQIILHTNDEQRIDEELVLRLLGIGDIIEIYKLFDLLIEAKTEAAINMVGNFYYSGTNPLAIVEDLLSVCNQVSKAKILSDFTTNNNSMTEMQLESIAKLATKTDMRGLAILWQMLFKGFEEVAKASNDIQALEMLIMRIGCLADLPTPQEVVESSSSLTQKSHAAGGLRVKPESDCSVSMDCLAQFKSTASLFLQNKEMILYHHLRSDVEIIKFATGRVEIRLLPNAPRDLATRVVTKLNLWTGAVWQFIIIADQTALGLTLEEYEQQLLAAHKQNIKKTAIMGDVMNAFPGAVIENIAKHH